MYMYYSQFKPSYEKIINIMWFPNNAMVTIPLFPNNAIPFDHCLLLSFTKEEINIETASKHHLLLTP